MVDALNHGLIEAMAKNDKVVVFGQDVAHGKGGVFGVTKGLLSRLQYFSYAVSYAEIQKLLNEGPSTKMDPEQLGDVPPYLSDTWWHTSVQSQK